METNRENGGDEGEVIDLRAPDPSEKDAAAAGGGEGGEGERRTAATDDEPIPPREREPETRTNDRQADDRQDDPRVARRRDEGDEDYSRRVRGRINRERALRQRSDRRVDELTIQNNELRDRLSRVERAQSAQTITDDAKKRIAELNAKIEACTAKLAAAKEAGDTKLDLQYTIELQDLMADRKIIERRSEYQADQARQAGQQQQDQQRQADPEQERIDRAAANWRSQNRNWFNLRKFSDMRTDAIELDKELVAEVRRGELELEPYSDEYFAELSTRLKELYPDLDVRGADGEPIELEPDDVDSRQRTTRDDDRRDERGRGRQPQRRHPAGDMGGSDRRRENSDERTMAAQGRVRLTQADYAQMREYNLDPNNPAHKKRFAQERLRTIMTEGQMPRGGAR